MIATPRTFTRPIIRVLESTGMAEALQLMHASGSDLALVTDNAGRAINGVAFVPTVCAR